MHINWAMRENTLSKQVSDKDISHLLILSSYLILLSDYGVTCIGYYFLIN